MRKRTKEDRRRRRIIRRIVQKDPRMGKKDKLYYVLDRTKQFPRPASMAEVAYMQRYTKDWMVGRTTIGDTLVCTSFLFLKHGLFMMDSLRTPDNHFYKDQLTLWETAVFYPDENSPKGEDSRVIKRYSSLKKAKQGHKTICEKKAWKDVE